MAGAQPSLTDTNAGIIQSLLIKAQRGTLDAIGAAVGTPVVYLKAAWADPVLYGGRGERTGSDIDILVRPDRFEAFAAELTARGFRRYDFDGSHAYDRYFGHKEWTFEPPAGALTVDLHRALTEPIWYDLARRGAARRGRSPGPASTGRSSRWPRRTRSSTPPPTTPTTSTPSTTATPTTAAACWPCSRSTGSSVRGARPARRS